MCKAIALICAAGLAVVATEAGAATTLRMLVSTDGVNFSSSVHLIPNSGIRTVEVLTTLSNTGTAAIGFSSTQIQPTVSNWASTDALVPFTAPIGGNTSTPSGAVADAPGQYGRVSPFAAVFNSSSQRLFGHVHLSSGGPNQPTSGTYLRIAQAQVTSWFGGTGNSTGGSGVNIKQLSEVGRTASDPAFNPALTNIRVFRFAVQINTNTNPRVLTVTVPPEGFGNRNTSTGERQLYWWGNLNEPVGSIREVASVVDAQITVIPGPTSLALLGLGGVALASRRRQS